MDDPHNHCRVKKADRTNSYWINPFIQSLLAQQVKNLPAMQEIWVQSLGQEGPLEEEAMATHSSVLAWKISWREEPGGLWSQRADHN